MQNAGRTLGSIALGPFWLIGRIISLFGLAALWIWQAFLDGLGAGEEDRDNSLDALFLIWLAAVTVYLIVWG